MSWEKKLLVFLYRGMLPCWGCSAFANLLLFCAILLFHIQRDQRREQQPVTTDFSCCYSLVVTHLHTEGCCLLITIHSWYVDMYASAWYMWTGRQGMEAAAVVGWWPHIGNHCLDTWLQPLIVSRPWSWYVSPSG